MSQCFGGGWSSPPLWPRSHRRGPRKGLARRHTETHRHQQLGWEPESRTTACAGSHYERPPGCPHCRHTGPEPQDRAPVAAESSIRPALCGRRAPVMPDAGFASDSGQMPPCPRLPQRVCPWTGPPRGLRGAEPWPHRAPREDVIGCQSSGLGIAD